MCRYGFHNYKITYGCFQCQVGFKRPLLSDVLGEKYTIDAVSKDFKCPNCAGEMANLGRDLRLPPKSKNEQWKAIKYLYDHQYNIYSCGCNGIGFVPHTLKEAMQLIEESKLQNMQYLKENIQREKEEQLKKSRKKNADSLISKMQIREIKKENKKL
jgi:hypothetical protein